MAIDGTFYPTTRTMEHYDSFSLARFMGTDGVDVVSVTAGGSGYTSVPTVTFTGGGGSSAAATAILLNKVVVGIIVTNPGSGYTTAPTVGFTGGGGSGATAVCTLGATVATSGSIAVIDTTSESSINAGGGFDASRYKTLLFTVNALVITGTSVTFKLQLSDDAGLTWFDAPAAGYVGASAPAAITGAGKQVIQYNMPFGGFCRLFLTSAGSGTFQGYVNVQAK